MIWPASKNTSDHPSEDQTVFMNQEPWLEDGTSQAGPASTQAVPQPKSSKKMLMLLGLGASGLLIMVAIVGVILSNGQPLVLEPSPTPISSSQPMEVDSFTKQFQQVRADLKTADPAKRELPFPPVDTKIMLQLGEKSR